MWTVADPLRETDIFEMDHKKVPGPGNKRFSEK